MNDRRGMRVSWRIIGGDRGILTFIIMMMGFECFGGEGLGIDCTYTGWDLLGHE